MANRSRLLQTIEESRLSVIIFTRDHTSLTLCFDELVNMIIFMSEMRPDTVFSVSYDAKQSKIDDQTGMYTIVLDKDEENCKDDANMKRWMDILIGVVNYEKSVVESSKRYNRGVQASLCTPQLISGSTEHLASPMSIIEGPPQFHPLRRSKGLYQYQYQYQYRYFILLGQLIWQKKRWSILWQRSRQNRLWWRVQPLQRFQTLESLLRQLG